MPIKVSFLRRVLSSTRYSEGMWSRLLPEDREATDLPLAEIPRRVRRWQASQRFATAGEILIGFANSFVVEFTGGDANLSASLANFSFIQPLLRQAGRDIALQDLTLTERNLLAAVRSYSQFRQGFYSQIAIGELAFPRSLGPEVEPACNHLVGKVALAATSDCYNRSNGFETRRTT